MKLVTSYAEEKHRVHFLSFITILYHELASSESLWFLVLDLKINLNT